MHVSIPLPFLSHPAIIPLVETSPSHPHPSLPSSQFLHPHSILQLPLGCKACKEIGVLCCIVSIFVVSPLPNLCLTVQEQKKSSCNHKVVFFLPEKEHINRYILYCYAHSSLTPSQSAMWSLLAARGGSVVCHGGGWSLLILLLQCLNEAGGVGGLPVRHWLCRMLPRTTATRGVPLLCRRSQRGRL